MSFKAGEYQKHFWKKEYEYESFSPSPINKELTIENQHVFLLVEEAMRLLGELNAYSHLVPDVDYFIKMHVRNEAVKSSQIEGTKTDINEALLPEEEIDPGRRDDWEEVQNYIEAMNWSIEALDNLPVSMRLIKDAHKILLSGVRGEGKQPGEVRKMQNWIGGGSLKKAHYVPPHPDELSELLRDFEYFWHNSELSLPTLVKIAISHYQFESIHPFNDGNGRIGRLLITLQLFERGILTKPTLYLSDFLEENREDYYNSLMRVRTEDNLEQWIAFFLRGVIETARKGQDTFENIVTFRQQCEEKIITLGKKAPRGRGLLLHLFSDPTINVNDAAQILDVTYAAANGLLKDFEELGIVEEITGHSRNRLFRMSEYVELFS
ncbi:MAG: Fic family protein [Candidatus Paceibacterota bacterium]